MNIPCLLQYSIRDCPNLRSTKGPQGDVHIDGYGSEAKLVRKLKAKSAQRRVVSITFPHYIGLRELFFDTIMRVERLQSITISRTYTLVEDMERLASHPTLEQVKLCQANEAHSIPFVRKLKRVYLHDFQGGITNKFSEAVDANPNLESLYFAVSPHFGIPELLPHLYKLKYLHLNSIYTISAAVADIIRNGNLETFSVGRYHNSRFINDAIEACAWKVKFLGGSDPMQYAYRRGLLRCNVLAFSHGLCGATPHGNFMRKDGDTAIAHKILDFLVCHPDAQT